MPVMLIRNTTGHQRVEQSTLALKVLMGWEWTQKENRNRASKEGGKETVYRWGREGCYCMVVTAPVFHFEIFPLKEVASPNISLGLVRQTWVFMHHRQNTHQTEMGRLVHQQAELQQPATDAEGTGIGNEGNRTNGEPIPTKTRWGDQGAIGKAQEGSKNEEVGGKQETKKGLWWGGYAMDVTEPVFHKGIFWLKEYAPENMYLRPKKAPKCEAVVPAMTKVMNQMSTTKVSQCRTSAGSAPPPKSHRVH
eukprot:831087-Rhodomonas_salina.1